ncbi:MAG: DegT/DnrJ/EryC1/StrS aminotransferase family protein [Candidatus Saccharimonadales bacterium]
MIRLIKSTFYHEAETKQALAEFILKEDILSMGKQCRMFEESFAAKQQRKHAVYASNGSVANLLLIQSMMNLGRFKKGDKIGFSALTWPTNVMPLIQLGLVPVAIDCELETLNVSPEKLKEYINDLKGLFLTNVLGFCDNLPKIKELCDEHGVILMEDNCESLGSQTNKTLLGNFGVASTFSFFVGHHMSTIEGGMVCTDDDELYEQMVMARAHGWDRNVSPETQTRLRATSGADAFYAKYTFYDIASNFRPTEINGFIGNTQIGYWDEIVAKRVSNFHTFQKAMAQNDDFYQYDLEHMDSVSNFSMPIICKTPELARQYRAKFEAAEVEIRPVIAGNMTKQPFYQKYVQDIAARPNSDLVHANGFYFGNNPEMTDEELDMLCGLLAK